MFFYSLLPVNSVINDRIIKIGIGTNSQNHDAPESEYCPAAVASSNTMSPPIFVLYTSMQY
ncbi:hypothetical protein GCM10010954_26610 [Halobacillus andaensis]|uniref:Uncharacterized protein n=1 Tax=Halobacillus andaensis TaxID=1176239 RepID=A0A917EYU2_HALAA|nr:hypothetical protein GCM10010954_26610 [Halobacillus andaensis]